MTASHDPALVPIGALRPHILLTNDDGVGSPGLFALKLALDPLAEVTVIAPDQNRTGAARSITMHAPLWVEEVPLPDGTSAFATDGTPVDCVRLGALGLLDRPPDVIFSGINLSGNLGDDITYSGTVAAAFEGIMLDIPAVAVSAEGYHEGYDLSVPADVAAALTRLFLERGFPRRTLLNVNCPDLSLAALGGVRLTTLGKRIYGDKVQLRETEGERKRYLIYGDELSYHQEDGTDFEAIASGCVSVTPIHFDLISREALETLRGWDTDLQQALRGQASASGGRPGAWASTPAAPGSRPGGHQPLEPRPATVIFDLDGTLVDSVELIVRSFDHAAREVLGLELPRERLIEHVGRPLREQMALLDEERADDLVKAYREYNHREHDRMLRLYPGMAELLLRLRARGAAIGLVTSKSRATTEMAFALTGIDQLLGASVCADETEHHKPRPEPLLRCLELLGAEGGEGAVYVGDAPYDLQAAKAAGVRSVAVTWGVFAEAPLAAQAPDRLVRDVGELATVLGLE